MPSIAPVILVFRLTGQGMAVAGVVAAEIVPVLLLGPFAGFAWLIGAIGAGHSWVRSSPTPWGRIIGMRAGCSCRL